MQEFTITEQEFFELSGYTLGIKATNRIRKHYQKFGDKRKAIERYKLEAVERNAELKLLRETCKQRGETIDRLRQLDMFKREG